MISPNSAIGLRKYWSTIPADERKARARKAALGRLAKMSESERMAHALMMRKAKVKK